MKFVDLFAGIGGFHQAMNFFNGECVFAVENDKYAAKTYMDNYGINCNFDICDVDAVDIPEHDVLCAGFPCQPFSVAGSQSGFDDETRGTLFFEIERILKYHHTHYILLENVRNFVSHDCGNTWAVVQEHLRMLGYRLGVAVLSPHNFGIPQLRERVFIFGVYDPDNVDVPLDLDFGSLLGKDDNSIYDILDDNVDEKYNISDYEEKVLTMWNEFYQGIDLDVIGFPIWVDYFTQGPSDDMSKWRINVIQKNNDLYIRNKEFIDAWYLKWDCLDWCTPTHRKFEWQAGDKIDSIWEGLIQFRQSGVRVKAPNCFPTLVAVVQTPVIGRYRRRLTIREAARLQSFPEDFILNDSERQAYKQLGNAVNVEVVRRCIGCLLQY